MSVLTPQASTTRRWLAPEVIQSSAVDCGPAALKSLLDGHDIKVSYGRLREACQTELDGTSIDSLEDLAIGLGVDAEQILVPSDHVLLPGARAVPAIAVIVLPPGVTHFVVVWRVHGSLVQVMDPRSGRRWLSRQRFREELFQHQMVVGANVWRSWAGSPEATEAYAQRIAALGVSRPAADEIVHGALKDPEWGSLAVLDAAIRTTTALAEANAFKRGAQAALVIESLYERARAIPAYPDRLQVIPKQYWSVSPASPEGGPDLWVRGAILVRVNGRRSVDLPLDDRLSNLLAEGTEERFYPLVEALRQLRFESGQRAGMLTITVACIVAGLLLEPVLFRALLGLEPELQRSGQRITFMLALVTLQALLLAGQWIMANETKRYGRRLEIRWRVTLQQKLSRLGDQYFRSRLTADMAERVHSLQALRALPEATVQIAVAALSLIAVGGAIVWVDPGSAPIVVLSLLLSIGMPLLMQPALMDRELRVRTQRGALSRFFFDALRGLVSVRYHNAQSAIQREHETHSGHWFRARLALQRAAVSLETIQVATSLALAAWIITTHLRRSDDIGSILLLVYWTLQLPALSQQIAQQAWQYPAYRNIAARVLELTTATEDLREPAGMVGRVSGSAGTGVKVDIQQTTVRVAGLAVLHGIDLQIEAGSHVAIVGSSGAGKSTLLGLLMGWHVPVSGMVYVDGVPLRGDALSQLWSETAWVDAGVHLWNRTLLENLSYGAAIDRRGLASVTEASGLRRLLGRLPDGLQAHLGEGAGMASQSEGQRIRLARAMGRPNARLVILDEPFSGLERAERARLLECMRTLWRGRTLLYASHDVPSTRTFDRVIVLDAGRIVEDGPPAALELRADSNYSALLKSSATVGAAYRSWRRLDFAEGTVTERGGVREFHG